MKFYDWLNAAHYEGIPPFGTPETDIIEGPTNQVAVQVLYKFKMESVNETGLLIWSTVEPIVEYLTRHTVSGISYRMAYDSINDVVFVSQDTWTILAVNDPDLEELGD